MTIPSSRIAQVIRDQEERKYHEEGALCEMAQKWMCNFPLARHEQDCVNRFTSSQLREFAKDRVDRTPNVGGLKILNESRRRRDSSTEEEKHRPKHPKHEQANFRKTVEIISANLNQIARSAEPEPSVGSRIPIQYDCQRPMLPKRLSASEVNLMMGRAADCPRAPPLTARPIEPLAGMKRVFGERADDSDDESEASFGSEPYVGPDLWIEYDERDPRKPIPIPGDHIIYNRENRIIRTRTKIFEFPLLDFIGKWNDSPFGSGNDVFAHHLGAHFHENNITIELPVSLVNELKAWWCHRKRDELLRAFDLSVAKCRTLTAVLAIDSESEAIANMYAPAVAFLESWDTQQNVSRVVSQSYIGFGLTYVKNRQALRTRRGKIVFGCSLAAIAVSSVVSVCAVRWIKGKFEAEETEVRPPFGPVRPWLWLCSWCFRAGAMFSAYTPKSLDLTRFGIEPNPGPGFDLVNCAVLPRPLQLKAGASIKLSEVGVRQKALERVDLELRGRQEQYGFDTKSYRPTGFASNRHNEREALYARVLADTVTPDTSLEKECLPWLRRNHRLLFHKMYNIEPVSDSEYLKRSNASPGVKRKLAVCFERLAREGIDIDTKLTRQQLYMFTKRSSFVKVENDLYTSPYGRKNKAPRLIQGATPEFICLVGPWIMAVQDLFKRRWSKKHFICFSSGLSAESAALFIDSGHGSWLEDDLGKFDSSIRQPWCEYEVWLCKQFGAKRAVLDLMRANIQTHGTTTHGWKYKCQGTRKSGDPYTSLMNSIINGLSHLFLYCKWTNKTVLEARLSLKMLVQGDDNLMRHTDVEQFDWQAGMAGLGFDSEAVYRSSRDLVEFCSSRLYSTSDGICFGPKPGRVLAKFGYVIDPPSHVSAESMMRGIALGLEKNVAFIPPLKVVVDRVLELTKGKKAWFSPKRFSSFAAQDEDTLPIQKIHGSTVETMLNLNLNYDWDYGKQKAFEDHVKSMNFGDTYDCIIELLLDKDTSGPQGIFGSGWVSQLPTAA